MSTSPGAAAIPPTNLVVVDTDVYSHVFVRGTGNLARDLKERLTGTIPVIATQTRAELQAWPRLRGWNAGRSARFAEILAATTMVPVTAEVIQAYVDLFVACRGIGHALHQRIHTADRWVAATAVALDRPLLSLDRVFENAPLVRLLPPTRHSKDEPT